MRSIRIVVILLAISMVVFPKMTFASETINTDTNTKNALLIFTDPSSAESISIEDIFVKKSEETGKTEEEVRYESILSKWKEKQSDRWKNLPKNPFTINASAYTASADECGNSKGITASGIKVQEKRTIACPPEFPFGVKIAIEGMGTFVCEDRGGAIKGNHFDIYMLTKAEAFKFGRKNLTAEIVEG